MPLTDYYLNKYSGGQNQEKPEANGGGPYVQNVEGQNSLMESIREQMR